MLPARAATLVGDQTSTEFEIQRTVECEIVLALLCTITAWTMPALVGTFALFVPKNYMQNTDAPVTVTDTFAVLNPLTLYTLKAVNKGLQDSQTDLVSRTVVTINGLPLIGPSNLNQNVSQVDVCTVTTEGADQVISGTPTANAGNTASTSIRLNIHKTPPTISASSSPSTNGSGRNNSNTTVAFTCNDALLGIANCTPPVTISADGTGQTISGTPTDIAGGPPHWVIPLQPAAAPAAQPPSTNDAQKKTGKYTRASKDTLDPANFIEVDEDTKTGNHWALYMPSDGGAGKKARQLTADLESSILIVPNPSLMGENPVLNKLYVTASGFWFHRGRKRSGEVYFEIVFLSRLGDCAFGRCFTH